MVEMKEGKGKKKSRTLQVRDFLNVVIQSQAVAGLHNAHVAAA